MEYYEMSMASIILKTLKKRTAGIKKKVSSLDTSFSQVTWENLNSSNFCHDFNAKIKEWVWKFIIVRNIDNSKKNRA